MRANVPRPYCRSRRSTACSTSSCGRFQLLLLALTGLICLVSGVSILVSIYNSMSDRRHEIAVMRRLGANRATVMTIILLESILLSLGGCVLGWLAGYALNWLAAPRIEAQTGVLFGWVLECGSPASRP